MAEIKIAASTINYMDNIIVDESAPEIIKGVKNIDSTLKMGAEEYLRVLEKAEKDIQHLQDLLARQKAIRHATNPGEEIVEQYQRNKEEINVLLTQENITSELYGAVIKFQILLNAALGQTIQTVYVFENSSGEPALYTIDNPLEVLKYGYTSKGKLSARFNVRVGDLDSALKKLQVSEKPEDLSGINTTYRYFKERYKTYEGKTRRVMWRNITPPPTWNKLRISSAGDIAEAYANVVLNHKAYLFNNSDYRINMDYFAYFIMLVDSTSGLLEGDVSINNIEYAIKSGNAAMMGIKQVENLAKKILQYDTVDLEQIKKDMHAKGKRRNKLEEGALHVNVEKIIEGLSKEYYIKLPLLT